MIYDKMDVRVLSWLICKKIKIILEKGSYVDSSAFDDLIADMERHKCMDETVVAGSNITFPAYVHNREKLIGAVQNACKDIGFTIS